MINLGDNIWLSASQLAQLGSAHVIDFPRTEKNARIKAIKLNWAMREVECQGGKRGVRMEFRPPQSILSNIQKFLKENPGFFSKVKGSSERTVQQKAHPVKPPAHLSQSMDDFVLVPRYDVRGSAGHGSVIHSEQIVDYLAFRKDWVKKTLGVTERDLLLISVKGDSMEPTLSNDDLILVNIRKGRIEDNAVYVLQHDGDLLVKRIQRKIDGAVIVKSDNPLYEQEVLDSSKAESLHVLGRVVWYGRKM